MLMQVPSEALLTQADLAQPQNPIGYNISTKVQTLIQSLIQLGGLVACLLIFKWGRLLSGRWGLWTASFVSVISVALQIGSTHLAALYIGRLLLGFSNGFYLTYSVAYMSEAAPAYLRGPVVGMVTFQTSFGALIGILVDNYSKNYLSKVAYQIPLAVMFFIPVVMSIGLLFLPETPRHYIMLGKEEQAAASIRRLRGKVSEESIAGDIHAMKLAWQAEIEMHASVRFTDAFRGTDLRRTFISVSAAVAQTATGIIFISAFSVYFYVQARIGQPFVWVMVALAIALTGNMAAFPASRFINRRHLVIACSAINSVMMFGMAIVYTVSSPQSSSAGKALVGLSTVFTWVYGFGQGPVLWAIQSEVPSQRLRSQTVGLAQATNYLFGWLCSYCTPYFINPESLNWGPKYCYIWGGSNLILMFFVFFFVPETKGRSLEQLDELFDKKVPTRRFAAYVTDLHQVGTDEQPQERDEEKAEKAVHIESTRAMDNEDHNTVQK